MMSSSRRVVLQSRDDLSNHLRTLYKQLQRPVRIVYWLRYDLRVHDNPIWFTLMSTLRDVPMQLNPVFFFIDHVHGLPRCSPRRAHYLMQSLTSLRNNGMPLLHVHHIHDTGTPSELHMSHFIAHCQCDVVLCHQYVCTEEISCEISLSSLLPSTCTLVSVADNAHTCVDASRVDVKNLPLSYSKFRYQIVPKLLPFPEPLPAPEMGNDCTRHVTGLLREDQVCAPSMERLIEICPPVKSLQEDVKSAVHGLRGGEQAGLARLRSYVQGGGKGCSYHATRNGMLGVDYSTKWSMYLCNGSLSARLCWWHVHTMLSGEQHTRAREALLLELLWRDYFQLLYQRVGNAFFAWKGLRGQKPQPPVTTTRYSNNDKLFTQWCNGETGNEFVDANMKELLCTGFMSNRGRQNVASYLIFDLHLDWRRGAQYFEHHLLDYDPWSNYGNWKYIAGTGTDVRDTSFDVQQQRLRYDPNGTYIKTWLGNNNNNNVLLLDNDAKKKETSKNKKRNQRIKKN